MTADEARALDEIHRCAAAGLDRYTSHATRRMDERGIKRSDVRHAVSLATRCAAQENGCWRVPGRDRAGDELTVVVALVQGVLVITAY